MDLILRRIALPFVTVATLLVLNSCAGLSERRPRFEIMVGAYDLTKAAVISSVRIEDNLSEDDLSQVDRFTIVISNGFDPVSGELRFGEVLQKDRSVKIRIGYRERNLRPFTVEGRIDSIRKTFSARGSAQISVEGSARVDAGALPAEPIRLEWGRNLLSFKPAANLAGQESEVSMVGWKPSLQAGVKVELAGLGSEFSQVYSVTQVTHSIGAGGYTTNFSVRKTHLGDP